MGPLKGPRVVSVSVRMIIAQQGEREILERIGKMCGGRVSELKTEARVLKDGSKRPAYEGQNLTVNLTYLKRIIEYFKEYPLKGKKRIAYKK